MAFYALSFQFDGIPSETYNLKISGLDASGTSSSMGSSSMDIINQKIFRRPTPYLLGMTPSEVLSFDVEITSPEEIDSETFQLVQRWMFSNRTFKKLLIFQEDMSNVYFNCIFNNPQILRVGNVIVGFTATVVCDSPFGYEFEKNINYTYTSPTVDNNVIFYNSSNDIGNYIYPNLVITMNSFGGSVTITNSDDANRVFQFTALSPLEVITMNNDIQTIASSTGLKRLSNFNKHFMRLVPGLNHLRLQGNFSNIKMTTQFVAKKIG
jgi:phage-related protein